MGLFLLNKMTTIAITNYYFEELNQLVQSYFNENHTENISLECTILMKNSRTYYLKFNQNLNINEIKNWMNFLKNESLQKNREVKLEVYTEINKLEHKFYFSTNEIYTINTKEEVYKLDESSNLIPTSSNGITFNKIEIPTQKLHSLTVIQYQAPQKTWWKFWKN
jgi:hypothetical protein